MTLVFQYGSNVDTVRLNSKDRLNGNAVPVGAFITEENFELSFTTESKKNNCAAADLVSGKGRKIWGVLYDIPERLIKRETSGIEKSLDAIEGDNYYQMKVKIRKPDGSPFEEDVMTYVVKNKKSNIQTNLAYVEHIIAGLRNYGIPEDYISYVKKQIVANNPDLERDITTL